jgi:hypothetical protein
VGSGGDVLGWGAVFEGDTAEIGWPQRRDKVREGKMDRGRGGGGVNLIQSGRRKT